MRIALCADGRSPHGQRWANGLVDRGHDIAFVWMREELAAADLSSFRASISHHSYLAPTPARPWMVPLSPLAPRRLARLLRPDLVHGLYLFFFSSRGRHTSFSRNWSSDVCSSD